MKQWYWYVLAALSFASAFAFRLVPDIASRPVFSYVFVVLFAVPSLFFLVRWLGGDRSVVLLLVLALFSYGVEYVGLVTGFPYGVFGYGSLMGAKIAGVLPVLLPFAYLPLVFGACALAVHFARRAWVRVLVATGFLVLFDLVLDPGAVALGLWSFAAGGWYYGVPLSNFAGWLLSGVFACSLFFALARKRFVPRQLGLSALLILSFWTGVALVFSLWVPFALGVVSVGLLAR